MISTADGTREARNRLRDVFHFKDTSEVGFIVLATDFKETRNSPCPVLNSGSYNEPTNERGGQSRGGEERRGEWRGWGIAGALKRGKRTLAGL